LNKVKVFLEAIYSSEDVPYNWHFDHDISASSSTPEDQKQKESKKKRLDFIASLSSGTELATKIKKDIYPTGNYPEFNLLTEFWAYAREQDPTINLGDHKFSWEE
jgi:hypothetical protein